MFHAGKGLLGTLFQTWYHIVYTAPNWTYTVKRPKEPPGSVRSAHTVSLPSERGQSGNGRVTRRSFMNTGPHYTEVHGSFLKTWF